MSQEELKDWSYIAPRSSNFNASANHSSFLEGCPPSLLSPTLSRPPGTSTQVAQTATTSEMMHSTPEETRAEVLKEQTPPSPKEAKSKYELGHNPAVLTSYSRRRIDAQKLLQDKQQQLPCRVPRRDGHVSPIAEATSCPHPVKVPRKPLSTLNQPAAKTEKVVPRKEILSVAGPSTTSTASTEKISAAKGVSRKQLTTQPDKLGTQVNTQMSKGKVVVFSSEEEPRASEKQQKTKASHSNRVQPFRTKRKFKEYTHVVPKDPSKLRKRLAVTAPSREAQRDKENVPAQKLSVPVPTAPASSHNSQSAKRRINETITLDDVIDFGDIMKSMK